jgi:hypothetical protein
MAPVSKASLLILNKLQINFLQIALKPDNWPVVRQEIFSANAKLANERFDLHPNSRSFLSQEAVQGALA